MAAMGKQRITSLASATALTVPDGAKVALISCTGANVRFWTNGDTPTASQGHQLIASGTYTLSTKDGLATALFIAESGSPVLEISYYNHQS